MKFGVNNSYLFNCGSSFGRRARYHPCTLVIDEYREVTSGAHFFARKFDAAHARSVALIDALDVRIKGIREGSIAAPVFEP
jgi:hypothetical protein